MTLARMRELYELEFSTAQIAKMAGVWPSTVKRRLKSLGVKMRPVGGNNYGGWKVSEDEVKMIVYLYYVQKLSTIEIGDLLDRHDTYVRRRLIWAGQPLRTRGEAFKLRHEKNPDENKRKGLRRVALAQGRD